MAGDDSEVTLNAFGKSVSIKGLGTIFIFIVLAFAGGLSFMLYDLSNSSETAVLAALEIQRQSIVEHKALLDTAAMMQASHQTILDSVRELDNSIKTQTYILLADSTQNADIKRRMSMPKQLRELGVRER